MKLKNTKIGWPQPSTNQALPPVLTETPHVSLYFWSPLRAIVCLTILAHSAKVADSDGNWKDFVTTPFAARK